MSNIILENNKICISINSENGAIIAIADKKNNRNFPFASNTFSMTSGGHTYFENARATACEKTDSSVEFSYCEGDFCAKLLYTLCEGAQFFEKTLSFRCENSFVVDSVLCENVCLENPANEIFMHDDLTIWHAPLNYFIRTQGGGLFCGIEYPYWETDTDGTQNVSIAFEPHFNVNGGEWFVSEKSFWGVYAAEGLYINTNGPYPRADVSLKYWEIFTDTGLGQHFDGMKVPETVDIAVEKLDMGEVWAMQSFLRYYMPAQPMPEKGFWMFQNGWWAGLFDPEFNMVQPLLRAGIKDLMTARMYYGHANHPSTEPAYIRDMNIEPMGFPIMPDNYTSSDKRDAGALHANTKIGNDSDSILGYSDEFAAAPSHTEFIEKAMEAGLHVGSFSTPNNAYHKRPQWYSRKADGTPNGYFGTSISCPACNEFMDFHYDVICRVLDRYNGRYWGFDGKWLNYHECAGYTTPITGPEPCYSTEHGHPAGDSRYAEVKNIQKFIQKLHDRYPNVVFEQYYGLKRASVWALKNLHGDENYYEAGAPVSNRFQAWHNENSRFRPVYMNFTTIMGKTPQEYEYALISSMSVANHAQIGAGFYALRDYPEAADITKKWSAWAKENIRFFNDRRCIFGMPGMYAADGSAHMLGDEGIIYIFATKKCAVDARIPMNRLIGLEEDAAARYAIELVAAVTDDEADAGCALCDTALNYGETLRCRLLPGTAAVLKVRRLSCNDTVPAPQTVLFEDGDAVVEAFPV